MNFYDILNIPTNATKKQIKNAYKKLVIKYHPDKNKDNTTIDQFRDIQNAYEVLYNDNRRKEYDNLTNQQKSELYDFIKSCFINISPQCKKIHDLLIKFYGDEKKLKNDINNFNFMNIYNRFIGNIINSIDDIPLYNKNTSITFLKKINRNIYGVIYTTLKDRYTNKFKKINVKRETNSNYYCIIPLTENEIIIKNEGETYSDITGDIIIKIICNKEHNFLQINDYDILFTKKISLSEYLYGGKTEFNHIDGEKIILEFDNCIDKIPIFCIKNKGMPVNIYKDDINIQNNIIETEYGNLYIHFKIDGINNDCYNDIDNKYNKLTKKTINILFPHTNQTIK